jgi:hypothetical protein
MAAARARSAALLAIVLTLVSPPAVADSAADRISELERRLETSLRQIDVLAKRLEALETARAPAIAGSASASAPTAAPAAAARLDAIEQSVSQMSDSLARNSRSDYGVPLHGFADVQARTASNRSAANSHVPYTAPSGFNSGMFDLYLTPEISDRVRALFEIGIEFGQADGAPGIDIERGQIGYVVDEHFTAWLGRFHTPYGYWNTAYHHGAQIQTALSRPRFIAFEDSGGVVPAHTVGAWGTGSTHLGDGKLAYDAFVGNGSRIQDGFVDMNNAHDDNGDKAFGGRLGYEFGNGVSAGAHFLREQIDAYQGSNRQNSTRVQVSGAYAVLDTDEWEGIAEYYHFDNATLLDPAQLASASGTHSSNAWFAQMAWQGQGVWVPYVRYEHAGLDPNDPYFMSQTFGHAYDRSVLGLRYNVTPKSALKFEVNHTAQPDLPGQDFNEARLQYAIRF